MSLRIVRAQLANFLQIVPLRAVAVEFISASLSAVSVASFLEMALEVGEDNLAAECMSLIAANTVRYFHGHAASY